MCHVAISMRIETNCSVTNVHCIVNPRNTETVVSRRTLTRGQVAGHGQYACPQCQLKNAAKRSTDKAVFHHFPYFKNSLDVENQHFWMGEVENCVKFRLEFIASSRRLGGSSEGET